MTKTTVNFFINLSFRIFGIHRLRIKTIVAIHSLTKSVNHTLKIKRNAEDMHPFIENRSKELARIIYLQTYAMSLKQHAYTQGAGTRDTT